MDCNVNIGELPPPCCVHLDSVADRRYRGDRTDHNLDHGILCHRCRRCSTLYTSPHYETIWSQRLPYALLYHSHQWIRIFNFSTISLRVGSSPSVHHRHSKARDTNQIQCGRTVLWDYGINIRSSLLHRIYVNAFWFQDMGEMDPLDHFRRTDRHQCGRRRGHLRAMQRSQGFV